jgi:hypothetical protein
MRAIANPNIEQPNAVLQHSKVALNCRAKRQGSFSEVLPIMVSPDQKARRIYRRMAMLNPNEMEVHVQERKRDLLRAAQLHDLYLRAEKERPQFGNRLMSMLGDLMISSGERLKARSSVTSFAEAQHS